MCLNAFHSSVYPPDCLSGGKLLSNMQRSGPKASMQGSIYWRHATASSSEEGGASRSGKSKPNEVMPTPPSLTVTFGQFADLLPPTGKDLLPPAAIGADAEHAADMVEDDRRVGKSARQVDRIG